MVASPDTEVRDDAIGRSMEIVGDRWSLLIVKEIYAGHHRFGQLQRRLGIARTVLSSRLQLLKANGIVERRRYHRDPDWFEYHLTRRGLDLYPTIAELMRWSRNHLAGRRRP
jgi:DNA-binding HxlR family transcriptional regulator